MATTFARTLRDERLRLEVGCTALAGLAVENLELSTPALSRAVRQSVIERRIAEPVVRMPGANRLEMHEVALPDAA
jgi:hypothetical protein